MKKIRLMILILFLVLCSGCWDMREINDLGFVTAVGVDKAKPPNRFSVTVQIANAGSASAKSEQGQTQSGLWTGTGEGKSLFDAIRKLIRISSRRIMWAHNNVIIIGESVAKDGILPVADFFTHNPELRMKTPVVVARGDAKDYILAKAGMETPSGLSFIYFNDYSALLGETIRSNMLTVSAALATRYRQPLIAAVSLKKATAPPESGGQSGGEKEAKTVDISGAAVFDRDQLKGWLSPGETRGIAWILNETRNTIVAVADPLHGNQSVSVETKGVKSGMIVKIVEGMPQIRIKITGSGSIVEEDGSTNRGIDRVKKQAEGLLDRRIAAEIKAGLQKIQLEYQSDVIGLAAVIRAQYKQEWESKLKPKWNQIFPQVQFTVGVRIHINSNTLKQEPARVY